MNIKITFTVHWAWYYLPLIYRYLEESPYIKTMTIYHKFVWARTLCLLFSLASLKLIKRCCICRNCIRDYYNHGLFGNMKCPIYELKISAVKVLNKSIISRMVKSNWKKYCCNFFYFSWAKLNYFVIQYLVLLKKWTYWSQIFTNKLHKH